MILFVYSIIAICLLIGIYSLIPAHTPRIKDAQGNLLKGSITSLEKLMIGGKEQWILLRSENTQKHILLFLNGGPGTADMTRLRRFTPELEKHFVVVTWDQMGAGKSYAAINPNSAMTINQFVSDTYELIEMLRHRFNQKKIYLAGHSWGSVIGILTVQRYPDLFYAYIGIGQVANMKEGEQLSYDWTLEQAQKAHDKGAIKKLIDIGRPPYTGDWQKKTIAERQLLGKYGGEVYGNSKGGFLIVLSNLIRATGYTIFDKVNFFRGVFGSMRLLWQELMTINFIEQVPNLKIPLFFMLGKHDYKVPYPLAEQYFNILEAPSKELIWFENSAHFLNIEENDKFNDVLINHVLPNNLCRKVGFDC